MIDIDEQIVLARSGKKAKVGAGAVDAQKDEAAPMDVEEKEKEGEDEEESDDDMIL